MEAWFYTNGHRKVMEFYNETVIRKSVFIVQFRTILYQKMPDRFVYKICNI